MKTHVRLKQHQKFVNGEVIPTDTLLANTDRIKVFCKVGKTGLVPVDKKQIKGSKDNWRVVSTGADDKIVVSLVTKPHNYGSF